MLSNGWQNLFFTTSFHIAHIFLFKVRCKYSLSLVTKKLMLELTLQDLNHYMLLGVWLVTN